MNEKTLRALVDAGAIKRMSIIGQGAIFYVEAKTPTEVVTASTLKGDLKTWSTLDSAGKWVRALGIGKAEIELANWQPGQRGMKIPSP